MSDSPSDDDDDPRPSRQISRGSAEFPDSDLNDGSPDVVLDPSWADRPALSPTRGKRSDDFARRGRGMELDLESYVRERAELDLTKPTPKTEFLPFFGLCLNPR
jgi:hypothetical protein